MTGIPLHPLRLRALDRMTVLRVPAKWFPDPDCVWCKGHGYEFIEAEHPGYDYRHPCRCIKPPYAPGDHFVKETCYICRSADDGEALCDPPVVYAADGAKKNDEYPFVRTARVMPSWAARHIVTLGPPVPCRLGDVTEEMIYDEGYDGSLYPCKRCHPTHYEFDPKEWHKETWNLMYPKHPYSPGLWTWGYPTKVICYKEKEFAP